MATARAKKVRPRGARTELYERREARRLGASSRRCAMMRKTAAKTQASMRALVGVSPRGASSTSSAAWATRRCRPSTRLPDLHLELRFGENPHAR